MLSINEKEALLDFRISGSSSDSLVEITASHVRNLILTGKLEHGKKLPGVRELSQKWPVSYVVIQKALERCRKEKLLTRHSGRGTFVAHERLSSKKNNCVYLVIQQTENEKLMTDYSTSEYFMGLVTGLQEALAGNEIIVMTISVTGDAQEKMLISRLMQTPADLVVLMRSKNTKVIDEISKLNIPLLILDPHVCPEEKNNIIFHDERRAVEDILNFFIENGRSKPGVLFIDDGKWVTANRLNSINEAIKARKLATSGEWIKILAKPLKGDETGAALQELLSMKNPPDSIIVSGLASSSLTSLYKGLNAALPGKPLFAVYDASPDFTVASFAVIIDSYRYGVSVGRLICNNFYKEGASPVLHNVTLPYPVEKSDQIH